MSSEPKYQFRNREYDRPNQAWQCGSEGCGLPCPLGPSLRGDCRAACTPIKEGERYYCENSSELSGACDAGPLVDGGCSHFPAQCKPKKQGKGWGCSRGQCSNGPLPSGACSRAFESCVPKRTVLAKRKLTVIAVVGAVLGTLLVLSAMPQRTVFVSAGPLTSHHSTLTTCSDCHDAGNAHMTDWLEISVAGHEKAGAQSAACLKCHGENLGEHAMFAHGLDASTLEELTAAAPQESSVTGFMSTLVNFSRRNQPQAHDQHDCSKCHKEHRGTDFDMKHITNLQCQTCHAAIFESFDLGHPEFENYPYALRTHIYFDHISHFGDHFSTKRFGNSVPPGSCNACHVESGDGRTMLVKGYEKSCANCHEAQVRDSDIPGIAFFAVPLIDMAVLENAAIDVGQWPLTYPAHVTGDGIVSAFTQILMSGSEDFSATVHALNDLDLSALEQASPEQLKQVEDFAWSFKSALHDLLSQGRAKLEVHLAQSLGAQNLQPAIAESFFERLRAAQLRWFPNLENEIATRRNTVSLDEPTETLALAPSTPEAEESSELATGDLHSADAGWYLHDSDLSIRYRPSMHADAWLKLWLEGAGYKMRSERQAGQTSDPMQQIFASLATATAPGRCMKCHTADVLTDGNALVNWKGRPNSSLMSPITQFDHQPHLVSANGENCGTCHAMRVNLQDKIESLFRPEFFHRNGTNQTSTVAFVPDFQAMTKASCAACHVKADAGQDCLTCHNYHVHR